MLDIDNPWARVKAHLLCGLGLGAALPVRHARPAGPGTRIHIFGYASDIERTDVLYTSVLIQMWHGLAGGAGARLEPQRARLAAQLAARLRHRRHLPGARRRAARPPAEATARTAAGRGADRPGPGRPAAGDQAQYRSTRTR